ncbi:tRNA uridine-5-carboxymethylaminomethyl(34) synthesis GTPase MnmE [soil metagenome]
MISKLSGWDETIVALATPPGIGAIGVIRVSGKDAVKIIDQMFPSKNLQEQASHTLHVGFLMDDTTKLDEGVISLYRNPKSYTGEDVVEISCHGSAFVQQQVIHSIIARGARLAKAGEFTQRAFLNGKLDLTQAEAVADLIASNTEASQQAAINNIRGGFSHVLQQLREELITFSSLIELELDFSEEDVEFADREKFIHLLHKVSVNVNRLLQSFKLGNVIKNGVNVAIVGKPNAGKSTLLNALLNENRAIVSDIAGTTRDTIEEILNIKGILFRLIDTAGIREHTQDVIENMGVVRSLEKIQQADIVVYVFDASQTSGDELMQAQASIGNKKIIFAANKADLLPETFRHNYQGENIIFIAAKDNRGIEQLQELLFAEVVDTQASPENVIITNTRHFEALKEVQASLAEIQNGLQQAISGDLLSADIRRCLHFLGEITGEITNEDRLDFIFSKFCIGK